MSGALTIPDLLAARAAIEPDRVAIELAGGAEPLTFAAWDRRAGRAARGLLGLGLRPGDRVGLVFDSARWVEFAVAYCAVQRAGGVAVPLAQSATAAEAERALASCAAALAVAAGSGARPARPRCVELADLEAGPDGSPPGLDARPSDLAQILYTSGTTGEPKGVGASHANLTFGCQPSPRRRAFAHSERFVHAFPIGTTAAQAMLLNAVVVHPAALVLERFDAERFCAAIEAHRAGTAFVVPTMAIELLNSRAFERHDLSSLLVLSSTGSALPPSVARSLAAVFPRATLFNTYSSTEALPAQVTMMLDPERPDSVGLPVGDAGISIRDEDGRPVASGEVGEVWLRSPTQPRSYYGDEAATARTFRDGWVRMGDLGRLDEDGHLYLVDRESDVVKVGAMRVSTTEVEAALLEDPEVRDAAVLGVPHPVLGSLVAAAVVVDEPGRVRRVRSSLRERLAPYKVPVRWLPVDRLPRNGMGKVVKGELRRRFETGEPRADPV